MCYFLFDRTEVRKGQLAHLNGNASDARFDNLVWLCLDHHDEYDSQTSQSKGLTQGEVRTYRERLYDLFRSPIAPLTELAANSLNAGIGIVADAVSHQPPRTPPAARRWRYPFWLVANDPSFFAYTSRNADGVCLIERINLPDGRIVIAMTQTAGNPGRSITNAVEEICAQLCERFELQPANVVWLQHYDDDPYDPLEWQMVTFTGSPTEAPFTNPEWARITEEMWRELLLRPKRRLIKRYGHFESQLKKLFPWPDGAL